MKKVSTIVVASLFLFSGLAFAEPEVVLTKSSAKNGTTLEFDFVADKSMPVSGLQFRVNLGKVEGGVNTDGCTVGLPTSHTGTCSMKNGLLTFVVYGHRNDELGTTHIGSVTVNSALSLEKKADSLFSDVVFGDALGKEVKGSALVNYN